MAGVCGLYKTLVRAMASSPLTKLCIALPIRFGCHTQSRLSQKHGSQTIGRWCRQYLRITRLRVPISSIYSSASVLQRGRASRVAGIGFLFVPTTAAGYIGVPPEKAPARLEQSTTSRQHRNSIGNDSDIQWSKYHQQILVCHTTPDSPGFHSELHATSSEIAS